MNIRAKFMLQSHIVTSYGGDYKAHEFVFSAQYDDTIAEDRRFAKATPTGQLRMTVDNPSVVEEFASKVGKQFYLDMVQAD